MTDALLVDVASYQAGIDLAKVKAAGYSRVNVKLSQGNWYTFADVGKYLSSARDQGMGLCTFHWLDNSASGAEQARIVLALMKKYGVLGGTAHQCDCEDTERPATWAIWRDYVTAMQDGLGRHIIAYTGDWWWTASGRGWNGASLTPYLWAAPNNGYPGSYPGDGSSQWNAGYGGWKTLAAMQYAVGSIAGAGGGDLSKTAFRDHAVWAALTGVDAAAATQEVDVNDEQDLRIKAIDRMSDARADMTPDITLANPTNGVEGPVHLGDVQALLDIQSTLAGLTTQVTAATAVLQAVAAGGTSIDTKAVIDHIDQVAAAESATVQGLQATIADLRTKLAAALAGAGQALA